MDTRSNACTECGFTTRDSAQFTRHVERHESGGMSSRKNSKAVLPPTTPAATTTTTDGTDVDFQHLLDLALPKIGEMDNASTNCSAEDEMIVRRLADLSRFLNANHQNRSEDSVSPMDLSAEKRPKMEIVDNGDDDDDDEEDGDGEKTADEKSNCPPGGHRQKTKSRSKSNGAGGGGGGKTTHKCPHCTFTTYMSQHMKSHLRAHENFIGQMYVCDVCGMAFSQKANMHRHRGTHSGVKPYECRFCQKRFFRKDQMQEHSMTHIKTGDDFDCPVSGCECKFSQHSLLRQHLDERHAISASQQAHCKRCTLQFANSRRLLLHYQTKHDEYYNAASPVADGHSPVKRLVVVNASSSESCSGGGGVVRPSSSSSAPSSVHHQKRKGRKRQRRQRSNSQSRVPLLHSPKLLADKRAENGGPPHVQQQSSGSSSGGYNVEELLRLNCASANAIVKNNAILPNATHSMFKMTSPASSATSVGFELFRDQLLRNTSIFAQQLGTVPPSTFSPHPIAQQKDQNQVAAAAAAHLLMQSFLMPPHHPVATTNSINHNHQGPANPPTEEEPIRNFSPKHLPLAKSPDCRGLVLHGFNAREGIGCEQKLVKHELTTTTTNSSSTPPMMISQINDNGMEEEEEGSESETGALTMHSKKQDEEMRSKLAREASREAETSAVPKSRHGTSSAHSSTTHSPSSASSTSSASNVVIGGESTASSSGANAGGASVSVESSPLKNLNNKLLSRALMSASSAASGTASEGLLLKGLMMMEPSSAGGGDMDCAHCGLMFSDQTLYLLHKGLHSEADPWRCNLCGQSCSDKYTFTTHMISSDHS
uniref:C2H2-type domain-containing protein n=1 Tax=Globodera rostochiensis TaxID=31243 RepID=A0A914HU71_GLORO